MSTGADNKTMPVTAEYAENFDRIFGERKKRSGRFVHRPGHPRANERGFVAVEDLGDEPVPGADLRVPVLTDRYMEGTVAPDAAKTDIGSRRKRRDYMRANNLADADDFKGEWGKAAAHRDAVRTSARTDKATGIGSKERREAIARALYQHTKT